MNQFNVIDSWVAVIPNAKGIDDEIVAEFAKILAEGDTTGWKNGKRYVPLTDNVWALLFRRIMGKPRFESYGEFTHERLRGYAVLIGGWDYGEHFRVSWYLISDPSKLSLAAKLAGKTGWIDPMKLSQSQKMELDVFASVTRDAWKEAARRCTERVNMDFTKEDERTRGLKNIS